MALRRSVQGFIDRMYLAGEVCALRIREDFRLTKGDHDILSVSFIKRDIVVCRVIVYLDEPSSGDRIRMGLVVRLFFDFHTVGCDAYVLGQEIESHIFAVQHEFDCAHARSPSHPQLFADTKTRRHSKVSQVVIGTWHKAPMTVVGHTQHFLFDIKLQFIRFLVKSVPSIVAAPFDRSGKGSRGGTQRRIFGRERVDIYGCGNLCLCIGNGLFVLGIDIYHR